MFDTHKKGRVYLLYQQFVRRCVPDNYQPVSITSVISKRDAIMAHLIRHNSLTDHHSTKSTKFTEDIPTNFISYVQDAPSSQKCKISTQVLSQNYTKIVAYHPLLLVFSILFPFLFYYFL